MRHKEFITTVDRTGGPARPLYYHEATPDDPNAVHIYPGMTIRDEFAAHAMTGIIAAEGQNLTSPEQAAWRAYRVADAMLAERAK